MSEISRASNVSIDRFLSDFVAQNRPVVIVDALATMDLLTWTPSYLRKHYGNETVQVYNDYFDLTDLVLLEEYLDAHFGQSHPNAHVPYVRWYTKLREIDFCWADEVFERMSQNWVTPAFFPRTDFVLPHAPAPKTLDPGRDRFPARGLFISGKGARTGLHVDPWGSDAILCQLHGDKTWTMYGPEQKPLLTNGDAVVDLENSDHAKFPRFHEARPNYQFTLHPGEAVYVPHGWFHAVHSDTDSVSFTWNFVHATSAEALRVWLTRENREEDLEVVTFFGVTVSP